MCSALWVLAHRSKGCPDSLARLRPSPPSWSTQGCHCCHVGSKGWPLPAFPAQRLSAHAAHRPGAAWAGWDACMHCPLAWSLLPTGLSAPIHVVHCPGKAGVWLDAYLYCLGNEARLPALPWSLCASTPVHCPQALHRCGGAEHLRPAHAPFLSQSDPQFEYSLPIGCGHAIFVAELWYICLFPLY